MRRAALGKDGSADKDRNFVTALARGLEILRCFGPSDEYLGTRNWPNAPASPVPPYRG